MLTRIRRKARSEDGFTLIEIIAVLVILAILAAVAVPKFFTVTEKAREKAAEGAMAEAVSRVNLFFARHILEHGTTPAEAEYNTEFVIGGPSCDLGDWTITTFTTDFTDAANPKVTVVVTGNADVSEIAGQTSTKVVDLPKP